MTFLAPELDALTFVDGDRVQRRLLTLRKRQGGDGNWWLAIIQHASLRALGPNVATDIRRRSTRLAVTAMNAARLTGDLEPRDIVPRKCDLAFALSRYGHPGRFSDDLIPDLLVLDSLRLAGMTPARASALEWRFRPKDIDRMRRLRRVRVVIAPAVRLRPLVFSRRVRGELTAWSEILQLLP